MTLGAGVGILVAVAIAVRIGFAGVPWLVNVALAKLGLIAAGGLLAGGASAVRLDNRRAAHRQLLAPPSPEESDGPASLPSDHD